MANKIWWYKWRWTMQSQADFIAVLNFIGTVAFSAKIQFETAPSLWMKDSLFSLLSISATFEHVCRFDATVCMQFIICFVSSNSRWLKLFKFNCYLYFTMYFMDLNLHLLPHGLMTCWIYLFRSYITFVNNFNTTRGNNVIATD